MKKPIAIISTDKHLKEENASELMDLACQEIELAKKYDIGHVIWLGDIFDSRLSQREELLTCLTEMIALYREEGIQILCIPGNHDKTNYERDSSFLTSFKHHPAFYLAEIEEASEFDFGTGDIEFHFIPFYSQDVWLERFNNLPKPKSKRSVLFSHTAVQGSINNDGKKVNNKIQTSLFKHYGKVFLGHYHDAQQPASNVFHLPSTRQNNFGENENKGFTILYDDLSTEFVKADFVPYKEIKVDLTTVTKEEMMALAKTDTNDAKIRVTLIGDQQAVKGVNKKWFTENGISVKAKYTDIEVTETEEAETVQELNGSDISEKFKAFCDDKGYNYKEGFELLKQIMKWE